MSNDVFTPDGQTPDPNKDPEQADFNLVGNGFFSTMGIPIVAGRGFNAGDTETSPKVAVINQTLARKFFLKDNPVGKTFNSDHIRIIGVSADAKYDSLRDETPPTFYVPYRQAPDQMDGGATYELRLKTEPNGVSSR